ncbi:MAG: TIGR01777 family protein [Candidatus Dadabacteria bacterium]|nr:TIGR01777 family protein [Candidatus Dadabacteria bacterium]MYA48303.1 TIGR01777 family protein [Candidatus Dadabacteria bacterium]MYF48209.1 TIGR01777 family protein [Candidatus Dadabacteria bacterium]MYG83247.1 TIGR01777 family protein [Candidatus Dadabacteria bacterium]MYK48989.1 TIGR01777 family protein [Candidatus Dadabacteria bacterium]
MKILISGSSGTVGTHLLRVLSSDSSDIWRLVRSRTEGENLIFWDPEGGHVDDPSLLEGFDAVVHLSGENIVCRWTEKKKNSIRRSRVLSTRYLVSLFSRLQDPPKTFICASAVGYYGDRGEERLTERSEVGSGFLPDTCLEWENEANRASDLGVRVINLRMGVVLSPEGGMLSSLLLPFKMGLGGVIGSGDQYLSWISIEDLSRIIVYLLGREEVRGPVNAVSPNPVTNREFTTALATVLRRPAWFAIPAFAVRLFFGEMGRSTMLAGSMVFPEKLLSSGYEFLHKDLGPTLEDVVLR